MRDNPITFFAGLAKAHGSLVFLPQVNAYVVSDPDLFAHILRDSERGFVKSPRIMEGFRSSFGDGLALMGGEEWKQRRQLYSPLTSQTYRVRSQEALQRIVDETLDEWQSSCGVPLNMTAAMKRYAMRVAVEFLFSVDIGDEASKMVDALDTLHAYCSYLIFDSKAREEIAAGTSAMHDRFTRARAILDGIAQNIIDERAKETAQGGGDLLSMFLSARDPSSGQRMSEREVREELVLLFFQAHDPSGNSLACTVYLLARHPEVIERIRSEFARKIGDRMPSIKDLSKLAYMRQVFDESLRVCPPTYSMSRISVDEVEYRGYRINRDATIFLSQWNLHHHPDLWPQPDVFDPDRFSPEASKARHSCAFIPFGMGPRTCAGAQMVRVESELLIPLLVKRYQPTVSPDFEPYPRGRLFTTWEPDIEVTLQPVRA
ncbi:MAG: cytochrome P450 [Proteobacteria bacterium]|nr:cytochrome P450 [Pseudomonadota bacterium]